MKPQLTFLLSFPTHFGAQYSKVTLLVASQGRREGGAWWGNLPRAPNLKGAPDLGANVKLSKAPLECGWCKNQFASYNAFEYFMPRRNLKIYRHRSKRENFAPGPTFSLGGPVASVVWFSFNLVNHLSAKMFIKYKFPQVFFIAFLVQYLLSIVNHPVCREDDIR